jgi:hypothetical protein
MAMTKLNEIISSEPKDLIKPAEQQEQETDLNKEKKN